MKTFRVLMVSTALVAVLSIVVHAQSGNDLFQKALVKERTEGDIAGAIKIYQTIVQKYGSDRKLAARALLEMADCYQKLGEAESRKVYERIVRDYADQKEVAAVATAHLGGASSTSMASRRLWEATLEDTYGTISPDGRFVSHINWETGSIGLRDLRTGTNRDLEDNPGYNEQAGENAISKDGKLVAYSWARVAKNNRYELHLANTEGAPNPRLLYENPEVDWIGAFDWTPDNKFVVVALKRVDRTAQIGLISVPDGKLRVIKSVDWRGVTKMFVSPAGKYLGYDVSVGDSTRERTVFILSLDGSSEAPAVVHPSLNFMVGWSPDGKRLLFTSDRSGSMALWGMPIADGKPQGSAEIIKTEIGWPEPIGVTRAGQLYYGINSNTLSNVQIATLDTSGRIASPRTIGQEQSESNILPLWSPDGRYLAYVSRRGLQRRNLQTSDEFLHNDFVVIRSAETNRIIRQAPMSLTNPFLKTWTTDGESLLVLGKDFQGRDGVFRVSVQTGEVVRLVDLSSRVSGISVATVSSDAKNLYFRRNLPDGSGAFISVDLTTGQERELIRRKVLVGMAPSPDAKYIAAISGDSASNTRFILAIPTDGSEPHELIRVATGNNDGQVGANGRGQGLGVFAWAPDSQSIYIRKIMNGQSTEGLRVFLDGSEPRKLERWDFGVPPRSVNLAIHPDGRRVAYTVTGGAKPQAEIWVLENFLPASKTNK